MPEGAGSKLQRVVEREKTSLSKVCDGRCGRLTLNHMAWRKEKHKKPFLPMDQEGKKENDDKTNQDREIGGGLVKHWRGGVTWTRSRPGCNP